MRVAVATCAALPGLSSDDRRLLAALRHAGVEAEPVVWEDRYHDWAAHDACVIRSAWDYAYRRDAFIEWSRRVADVTTLVNPVAIVEWNTHKQYLCDLAARGVRVVPTVVLPAGARVRLDVTLAARGWTDVVIKAAVAQTGRYFIQVGPADHALGQAHLDRLLPHEDMLIQPFLTSIGHEGELSLVFIDGELTHAIRKRAAAGDARVHLDYGGTEAIERPNREAIEVAQAALAASGSPLLYARIDLVRDNAGRLAVMEAEFVEPDLFFRHAASAVERMVAAILRLVHDPG